MEENHQNKQYQFYKIPQIQNGHAKTKVFFVCDNTNSYTKQIENIIYEYIKTDIENYELVAMSFQDVMSRFGFEGQKKKQFRQLFEGYDLFCSDKTSEYFAQQFTLSKATLAEFQNPRYFKDFVINLILEHTLEQTIHQTTQTNVIVVLMMKALEYFGIRELQKNFYPFTQQKSKIIFIDTGDLELKKKKPFITNLFTNFSSEASHSFFYEQSMPKNKAKTDENFFKFLELISPRIVQSLNFTSKINLQKQLMQFPWSNPSEQVMCGSIAVSLGNQGDYIFAQDKELKAERIQYLDLELLVNVFTIWVNELVQLKQIDSIDIKEIILVKDYLEDFLKIQMNQILNNKEQEIVTNTKLTVKQRFLLKQRNLGKFQIQLLIKTLKGLSGENDIMSNFPFCVNIYFLYFYKDKLSEEQLEERQKIGTIIGKYHQRAIQMQGLNVVEFVKMKENFTDSLRKIQKQIDPDSDEVRSIITLENFKDIILQEDIFEALQLIKNQYNLISSFPLVGLGVKQIHKQFFTQKIFCFVQQRLHRSNGSMINPYLVQVVDIARINQYVDTISIQNTPDKELVLNAGYETDNYDKRYIFQKQKKLKFNKFQSTKIKETIDAVVPLFGPKDYDLKPLLQSNFFHVLTTFNVMNNVDTIYREAYFALLANTLIFLLNEDKSDFISDLLDKIYHSVCIVYKDSKFFQEFCKMLVKNPRLAMVTYHEGHPTQCQGPSKAFLVLFYLVKAGELSDRALIKEILEAIMQEIVARGIKNTAKMSSYFEVIGFDIEVLKNFGRRTVNRYIDRVLEFSSIRQMMMEVESTARLDEALQIDNSCRLRLNKKKFEHLNFGKYNFFTSLKNICEFFLKDEKFKGELLWFWLYHIQKYNNSYVRNSTPIITNIKNVYKTFKKQKINKIMNIKFQKVMDLCEQKLQASYQEKMAPLHIKIIPSNYQKMCEKLGEKDIKITFNNVSNLCKSYCLCPDCPFYLKKLPNLSEHIQDSNFCIPAFCKTIKKMRNSEPKNVFYAIKDGAFLNRDHEKEYILAYNKLNYYLEANYFSIFQEEILDSIKQCQLIYKYI